MAFVTMNGRLAFGQPLKIGWAKGAWHALTTAVTLPCAAMSKCLRVDDCLLACTAMNASLNLRHAHPRAQVLHTHLPRPDIPDRNCLHMPDRSSAALADRRLAHQPTTCSLGICPRKSLRPTSRPCSRLSVV
jgi:hypothetical protein